MLIEQPWGVSAFGEGRQDAEPDTAVVRLAINRLSSRPDAALSEAKDAAGRLRSLLRGRGVPDTQVTSSRTSVQSQWDGYGSNRRFHGHQCRVEFSIRLTDLDIVEPAVVELVDAGADEIMAVEYTTSRLPYLRVKARQQAVAAAQATAGFYAEAAGVRLGPVVHIEDVDPERVPLDGHRALAMDAGGGGGGGGTLVPGQVTVVATVVVGFSIAH